MQSIICDIDDTLLSHGSHPIEHTIKWINDHYGRYKIILVTGRPESTRSETVRNLKSAGVRYNRLIMNPGSTADTADYKYRVGKRIKPVLAIDNNETMRAAYERAGIKAIHPKSLNDNMLKLSIY
jgi:hydroxymethylpyrimidine pyrophosphatase-like HAD family hydrolase